MWSFSHDDKDVPGMGGRDRAPVSQRPRDFNLLSLPLDEDARSARTVPVGGNGGGTPSAGWKCNAVQQDQQKGVPLLILLGNAYASCGTCGK